MEVEEKLKEIDEVFYKIIFDKYFNNDDFREKIKNFISYKEEEIYIGGTIWIENEGTEKDINHFFYCILMEVYLKILVELRKEILNNKENIQKEPTTYKMFKSIFLFEDDEVTDIISSCCKNEVIKKFIENIEGDYQKGIKENYYFIENFHKDNTVLKLLAISLKDSDIIKKSFSLNEDPNYEIELGYKNNGIYNSGTIKNKRISKFVELYTMLRYMCGSKVIINNNSINKWLSIYEVNEISRCINIVSVGSYRKSVDSIKKMTGVFDEKYEIDVRKILLENKVIILDYLLENYPIIDKLFNDEKMECYNILKDIFNIIDKVAEEIINKIKRAESLELILEVILTFNKELANKNYKNIFNTKLKNIIGKGIIDMYNINYNY